MFSLTLHCVWEITTGDKAHFSMGPDDILDKCDITGRTVQFHRHIFSGHTAMQNYERNFWLFLGTTKLWFQQKNHIHDDVQLH